MYVCVHEKKIQLQLYHKEGDTCIVTVKSLFCLPVGCICEAILALKVAQEYVGMCWGFGTVSSANDDQ